MSEGLASQDVDSHSCSFNTIPPGTCSVPSSVLGARGVEMEGSVPGADGLVTKWGQRGQLLCDATFREAGPGGRQDTGRWAGRWEGRDAPEGVLGDEPSE